jgi:hypothetical protein
MRNPLSALIGCADEIIASLNEYRSSLASPSSDSQEGRPPNIELIVEAIEAADTIIYCAMHQVSLEPSFRFPASSRAGPHLGRHLAETWYEQFNTQC